MNFFVACIFYSVVPFEELKFLIESNLQYIPLWFILLKNLEYDFFYPKVIKITSILSSKSFIVLSFPFKSLTHLELIF